MTLYVQEGGGGPFGVHPHLPGFRPASPSEVLAAARELEGAEKYDLRYIEDAVRLARHLDKARHAVLVVPIPEERG